LAVSATLDAVSSDGHGIGISPWFPLTAMSIVILVGMGGVIGIVYKILRSIKRKRCSKREANV
jgi:hypothetical protein